MRFVLPREKVRLDKPSQRLGRYRGPTFQIAGTKRHGDAGLHTFVILTWELLSSRYQVRWQGLTHGSIRQKSATHRWQAVSANHARGVCDPLDRRVGRSCRLLSASWSAISFAIKPMTGARNSTRLNYVPMGLVGRARAAGISNFASQVEPHEDDAPSMSSRVLVRAQTRGRLRSLSR